MPRNPFFGKSTVRAVTISGPGGKQSGLLSLGRQVAYAVTGDPKVRRAAADASGRQIQKVATEHYQNAVDQVRRLLASDIAISGIGAVNPGNTGAAASKRIYFTDADGGMRYLATRPWNPLTYRYANRARRSFRFWRKQGKLGTAFASSVSWKAARAIVSIGDMTDIKGSESSSYLGVVDKTTGRPFTSRGKADIGIQQQKGVVRRRMRARYTVSFSSLRPGVVDSLISESFVLGSERPGNSFKFGSGKLTGADIIAYPELARSRARIKRGKNKGRFARGARRPFIVQLSARLGRYMHTAIRRL
jgi:hypothetical protein